MISRARWAAIFFILFAADARADQDPIEKYVLQCVSENSTTAGMVGCASNELMLWDRRLNASYQRLMATLPPEGRQALRSSQRKWLEFRDAELSVISEVYSGATGSLYRPLPVSEQADLVRSRTLELEGYEAMLELINESL